MKTYKNAGEKIAELTLRKDAMENEIAGACATDPKQLKDLNIAYAELRKQLKAAEGELEKVIGGM